MTRRSRAALFVAMAFGVAAFAVTSAAQNRGRGGGSARRPQKVIDGGAGNTESSSDAGLAPAQGVQGAGPSSAESKPSDAGSVEVRKLGDGGQAMRFSELDIEGRLRSPQLVYFLRRVRAEFAAGELGHRTFMRELSETRKGPSF